ncbi:hypothetical protein F5Y15DRAFT_414726 [Xylariaceae sp. FL0016]|nr:hypothetical protein F5Y15DRAFT_414726 [Xylariaceae sp. FL0016]
MSANSGSGSDLKAMAQSLQDAISLAVKNLNKAKADRLGKALDAWRELDEYPLNAIAPLAMVLKIIKAQVEADGKSEVDELTKALDKWIEAFENALDAIVPLASVLEIAEAEAEANGWKKPFDKLLKDLERVQDEDVALASVHGNMRLHAESELSPVEAEQHEQVSENLLDLQLVCAVDYCKSKQVAKESLDAFLRSGKESDDVES